VPIYEVLKVPGDDDKVIIVMPLLRRWDEPEFETVGEGVDLFRQLFEVCDPWSVLRIGLVEFHGFSGLAIYTQTTCGSSV
jgi:hypothetical protein